MPSDRHPASDDCPAEWPAPPCPEISPDFVERTWQRVLAERAATAAGQRGDLPPRPSLDFVERTWRRIADDRRLVPSAAPARHPRDQRRRRLGVAAAAAAVLGAALVWSVQSVQRSRPSIALPLEVVDARALSPDRWGTALQAQLDRGARLPLSDPGLRIAALAGLQEAGD